MKEFTIEVATQKKGTTFLLKVDSRTFTYFVSLTKQNHYLNDPVFMLAMAENYKKGETIYPEFKRASGDGLDSLVELVQNGQVKVLSGDMIQIVFTQDKENIARYKFRIQNFDLVSDEFDFFKIYESKIRF